MKVLHILEATRGGTRRHVLDLLPALRRSGVECDLVYSLHRNPEFAADAAALAGVGVGLHAVPMARGFGGMEDARALAALRSHLRRHRYDVIHCHSTKAGLLGRLARLTGSPRTPLIYTPHCLAFATGLPLAERRLARVMEKLLAPLTSHFIAVSRHEQRIMLRAGLAPPARATVIYNGIDLEEFDALQPGQHLTTSPPRHLTVGCFGRLTRQKDQAALIRALPRLRQAAPRARLLLVGGGEDEPELRALAERLRVADAIDWAGELAEARPHYARCEIVAQPSRWEGCPYSILEAMAACRPVVAASVGGVPELIRSAAPGPLGLPASPVATGLLCRPNDVARLTEHLTTLATDAEARTALGTAARHCVESSFRLETMVEGTLRVYRAVGG